MPELGDATQRESYGFWTGENLRYSDTDMLGHINNVAYAALFESGRVDFTHRSAMATMPRDRLVVMVRLEIDYRREMHWPGKIDIGSRLLKLGTTSFQVGNAIFKGEICHATAVTRLVVIDRATRKSAPLSPEFRAALPAMMSPP
jgi:acyl-CoA thioester hydrolase